MSLKKIYKKKVNYFEYFSEYTNYLNKVIKKIDKNQLINFEKKILNLRKQDSNIFVFGNGGAASTAITMCNDLGFDIYKKTKKKPFKFICLNENQSILTAIGNDIGYENIFSRQLEGIANHNDVLIIISTSGNSKNIINAIKLAKKKKIKVLGLLGKNGGACKNLIKNKIIINSNNTARIQEMHIMIGHIICDLIEEQFGI